MNGDADKPGPSPAVKRVAGETPRGRAGETPRGRAGTDTLRARETLRAAITEGAITQGVRHLADVIHGR